MYTRSVFTVAPVSGKSVSGREYVRLSFQIVTARVI